LSNAFLPPLRLPPCATRKLPFLSGNHSKNMPFVALSPSTRPLRTKDVKQRFRLPPRPPSTALSNPPFLFFPFPSSGRSPSTSPLPPVSAPPHWTQVSCHNFVPPITSSFPLPLLTSEKPRILLAPCRTLSSPFRLSSEALIPAFLSVFVANFFFLHTYAPLVLFYPPTSRSAFPVCWTQHPLTFR